MTTTLTTVTMTPETILARLAYTPGEWTEADGRLEGRAREAVAAMGPLSTEGRALVRRQTREARNRAEDLASEALGRGDRKTWGWYSDQAFLLGTVLDLLAAQD